MISVEIPPAELPALQLGRGTCAVILGPLVRPNMVRCLGFALAGVIAGLGCNATRALDLRDAAAGADVASSPPAASADAATPPPVASPDATSPPPVASPDAAPAPPAAAPDAGSTPEGRVPYRATAIALGDLHACALLEDGNVKCWGGNDYGQLGLGDTMRRNGPVLGAALPTVDLGTGRKAVAIAAGHYTTCASLDDGSFRCWGLRALTGGTGSHGDTPGSMGDALPGLDLGPGRTMRQAAIGYIQAFGLLDDGSVKAWQSDRPVEIRSASAAPKVVALTPAFSGSIAALFADGSLALLAAAAQPVYTQEIANLQMGAAVRAIGGNDVTMCIALVAGGLRCATQRPVTFAAQTSFTAVTYADLSRIACGLRDDGGVICDSTGVNRGGSWWVDSMPPTSEPGSLVALGQPAKAIAAGQDDVCAVLADGTVKCWSDAPSPGYGLSGNVSSPAELRAGPWLPVDLGTRPE
jgi:hypothetical protein